MAASRSRGRRRRILGGLAVLLVLAAAYIAWQRTRPAPERPSPDWNLLVILLDTVRVDRLGCYGNPIDLTPEIDRFAAQAVRFENAFAHAPWTLPSVASLYTSRHPEQHGAGGRLGDFRSLREDVTTLAEVYAAGGYQTAAVVNVMFLTEKFGLSRGFEVVNATVSRTNLRMRRAGPTTDIALQWLDTTRGQPFFLLVHYFDPHLIYDPPEPYRSRYADPRDAASGDYLFGTSDDVIEFRNRQKTLDYETITRLAKLYMGEVAYVDQEVGRLLAGVAQRGLDSTTVVVLTADHGEEFGDHGNFEHGHSFYDELLHIPLLIRTPETEPRTVATTVGQIDVAPTLCDLMGFLQPASFTGRSFAGLLQGAAEPDRQILAQGNMWLKGGCAWRKDGFKLIRSTAKRGYQLFDVRRDPRELEDLAHTDTERCAAMIRDLELIRQGLAAESGAGKAPRLSEEDRRRLRSLGYLK
jgi:arylsulfatase A-like enzyme